QPGIARTVSTAWSRPPEHPKVGCEITCRGAAATIILAVHYLGRQGRPVRTGVPPAGAEAVPATTLRKPEFSGSRSPAERTHQRTPEKGVERAPGDAFRSCCRTTPPPRRPGGLARTRASFTTWSSWVASNAHGQGVWARASEPTMVSCGRRAARTAIRPLC